MAFLGKFRISGLGPTLSDLAILPPQVPVREGRRPVLKGIRV